MTPTLRAKILRLFGVPDCGECAGSGDRVEQPSDAGRGTTCIAAPCPSCDGVGVTFRDATLENWPWWRLNCPMTCPPDDHKESCEPAAYLPDFPNDPAAVVVLEEQMARKGQVNHIVRINSNGDVVHCVTWELDNDDEPGAYDTVGSFHDEYETFAAGLLAALDATS